MEQKSCSDIIKDQTIRALWEVKNVIDCVSDELWDKAYCQMPLWKHIYHTLHSLDLWFINPRDAHYKEPQVLGLEGAIPEAVSEVSDGSPAVSHPEFI